MQIKQIEPSNLPTQFPISSIIAISLLLDKLNIPTWGWGVWWTLVAVRLSFATFVIYTRKLVNVIGESK